MPIISTKRLQKLVSTEINAALEKMHNDLLAQVRLDAKLHITDVQYKMMMDQLVMAQGRNEQLVQANRELIASVTALKQILSGQAHEALRLALDSVIEKCKADVT
jgi:hypothetical protein